MCDCKGVVKIAFKTLCEGAKEPVRATDGSVAFDMFADSVEIYDDRIICHTGISAEIPMGYGGFLFPRSSVCKTGLFLANSVGVIDSDFRGEIRFVFYKNTQAYNAVNAYMKGDRCGQIVILPIPAVEWVKVSELSTTERGEGGFGSTGK